MNVLDRDTLTCNDVELEFQLDQCSVQHDDSRRSVCWASSSALSHCTFVCLSVCPCPPVCLSGHVSACFTLPNYPLGTIKIDWTLPSVNDWSFVRCLGNAVSLYANLSTFAAVCLPARSSLWFGQTACLPPTAPSSGCRSAGFPSTLLMFSHPRRCLSKSSLSSPTCQALPQPTPLSRFFFSQTGFEFVCFFITGHLRE